MENLEYKIVGDQIEITTIPPEVVLVSAEEALSPLLVKEQEYLAEIGRLTYEIECSVNENNSRQAKIDAIKVILIPIQEKIALIKGSGLIVEAQQEEVLEVTEPLE